MLKDGGARQRILNLFLTHIGEIITKDEIEEVARIHEWARRVRELRDELGYQILSHNSKLSEDLQQRLGIVNLRPGDYIMISADPIPAVIRGISKDVRESILERDGATCRLCGRGPHDIDPYNSDKRVVLNIDHIQSLKEGGNNDIDNLMTICSVCNEGKKSRSFLKKDMLDILKDINVQPPDIQKGIYARLRERWGNH